MASILIVDDEANIRASLAGALGREGYSVEVAASLAAARTLLAEAFDVVLLDVAFPGENGLDLLAEVSRESPETTVIMMSGHATLETAVQATRLGAYDFLEKPVSLERLLVLLRNATKARELANENARLKTPWAATMVGRSAAMERVIETIATVAAASATVLLQGETGTGKELAARAIHAASPRRDRPFVALNCGAIPETLFESEIFGHERGAFTGAMQARAGAFEAAHQGVLFLDEVHQLSPSAQTKLLRVLSERRVTRVGGRRETAVDVRLIAATNRDLHADQKAERFHSDLYFRLAVVPITLPPLRERREDIPALAQHFVELFAREAGRPAPVLTSDALERLAGQPWPGNVREMRNVIERLVVLTPAARLTAAHVQAALAGGGAAEPVAETPEPLAEAVEVFERAHIARAIAAENGNMTRAAARLGLERSHLYKKMRQLEMRAEREPGEGH